MEGPANVYQLPQTNVSRTPFNASPIFNIIARFFAKFFPCHMILFPESAQRSQHGF